LIWIGTDDGKVQLTRDGGKNWTDVTSKIVGMPKGAWIPQVKASTHKAGEVFVVLIITVCLITSPIYFAHAIMVKRGKVWFRQVS
jgi:hypothetical protein